MFKNLTVGKRIILGFTAVLIVLGVIVVTSYNKISYIAHLSGLVQSNIEQDAFLVEKEVDHLNWAKSVSTSIINDKDIEVQLDPTKCGFGKWLYSELEDPKLSKKYPAGIVEQLKSIEPIHKFLHESAKKMKENYTPFDVAILASLTQRWIEHLTWMKNLQMSMLTGEEFKGGLDPHNCKFGKWFYSFKTSDPEFENVLNSMEEPHKSLHHSAEKIMKAGVQTTAARKIFEAETEAALGVLAKHFSDAFAHIEGLKGKKDLVKSIYFKDTAPSLHQVQEKLKTLRHEFDEYLVQVAGDAAKDLAGTAAFAENFVMIMGIVSLLLGIILALVITKSITKPVIRIAGVLRDSATQVASASGQLSTASQELSSASSEQASSIEETSASLEEITGMVNNNVDNARNCVALAERVSATSGEGNQKMEQLIRSMSEILASNEKIQDLVKVIGEIGEKTAIIDEIVFQTKLLSFNASVEAERAGEHGRGFAVVAQEVGNLAQMSGKAATEISSIVKESIRNAEAITSENKAKVESGNKLVEETAGTLKEIADKAETVSRSLAHILSASQDQSSGIGQINNAISQLDKATQENAATAEEAASSSEELSAQAENLNAIVNDLSLLVMGGNRPQLGFQNKKTNSSKHYKTVSAKPLPKRDVRVVIESAKDPEDNSWESL